MGYYTRYSLEYSIPADSIYDKELEKFKDECAAKNISVPQSLQINPRKLSDALDDYLNDENSCNYGKLAQFVNGSSDSVKWYNYDVDLEKVSKMFPTVLFTLKGEGEESDDIWVHYFKGGKSYKEQAKITFDPFDECKLK